MKKLMKAFSLILALGMLMNSLMMSAFAQDVTQDEPNSIPRIVYVTPEEMEQLAQNIESGVMPSNFFPDLVAVSVSLKGKVIDLQLMNVGFPLDRVDVTGTVHAYDHYGLNIGNQEVDQPKLVYGFVKHIKIQCTQIPAYADVTLTLSDGDAGTTTSERIEF